MLIVKKIHLSSKGSPKPKQLAQILGDKWNQGSSIVLRGSRSLPSKGGNHKPLEFQPQSKGFIRTYIELKHPVTDKNSCLKHFSIKIKNNIRGLECLYKMGRKEGWTLYGYALFTQLLLTIFLVRTWIVTVFSLWTQSILKVNIINFVLFQFLELLAKSEEEG